MPLKSPEWLLCGLSTPHSFRRRNVQASKVEKKSSCRTIPNFDCGQRAAFRLCSTLLNVRAKRKRQGLKSQN